MGTVVFAVQGPEGSADQQTILSSDSLKVYVFVKYIGQGIADSEILQLGYISEEDDKPNLIAVFAVQGPEGSADQ